MVATLIICNKILDEQTIEKIWGEIKMIDILKFAHDKGKEEGEKNGEKNGLTIAHDMLLDTLYAFFGIIPGKIVDMVKSISHFETLKELHKQVITNRDFDQFEKAVVQVARQERMAY